MKKMRIVVALGGNALGSSPAEQITAVKKAAETIGGLIAQGHEVIISHGNGPQVGMINSAMDSASHTGAEVPPIPFAECTAMSQGYIGYHLQQALEEEIRSRRLARPVASIVTQVVVDPEDPAFQDPRKPIGAFCTLEEAEAAQREKGWIFAEDAGRGYRRVVPSPEPREIVELEAIVRMLSGGIVVIAAGGGGIPVVRTPDGLKGVDAVIDKDRSSARLAEDVQADVLMMLTAVDRVCLHYRQPDQEDLATLTAAEAREYMRRGQFAAGSMLPKVEAGVRFAESAPGRFAVITSLAQAGNALTGGAGTRITAR